MNIYNIALINVIATILLALLTVVAFIGREPLKSTPLPEKMSFRLQYIPYQKNQNTNFFKIFIQIQHNNHIVDFCN